MENTMEKYDRLGGIMVSVTLLMMGMGFIVLGVTLFPVFGIVIGMALIYSAFSPMLRKPFRRAIKVVIGIGPEELKHASIVPVTILSTSRERGDDFDFDASTVNGSTISFGPDRLPPVDNMGNPVVADRHLIDMDGDGAKDFVFHFHVGQKGLRSRSGEVCVRGETVYGEQIEGCTKV